MAATGCPASPRQDLPGPARPRCTGGPLPPCRLVPRCRAPGQGPGAVGPPRWVAGPLGLGRERGSARQPESTARHPPPPLALGGQGCHGPGLGARPPRQGATAPRPPLSNLEARPRGRGLMLLPLPRRRGATLAVLSPAPHHHGATPGVGHPSAQQVHRVLPPAVRDRERHGKAHGVARQTPGVKGASSHRKRGKTSFGKSGK